MGDEMRTTDPYDDDGSDGICDGSCTPMCDWCLVGHACPDECGGEDACPYVLLEQQREEETDDER